MPAIFSNMVGHSFASPLALSVIAWSTHDTKGAHPNAAKPPAQMSAARAPANGGREHIGLQSDRCSFGFMRGRLCTRCAAEKAMADAGKVATISTCRAQHGI